MSPTTTGDTYNAALAAALLARKEEIGVSFDDLAAASGIGLRSVKRYLHDERHIRVTALIALGEALRLNAPALMDNTLRLLKQRDNID